MKKLRLFICLSLMGILAGTAKATTYDTLMRFGATWRYLANGSDQGATAWKTTGFSDATWGCGPSPIGYGDTWIVTCIPSGCVNDITCAPACGTKWITTYFRNQVSIGTVGLYDSVIIDGLYDDGIAMYVNGTQVYTYNMPTTWIYTDWSTTTVSGSAETTAVHQVIPITGFITGNNTIAVELHQRGPTSSDITLDMRLLFKRHSNTSVNSIPNGGVQFELYPNPSNGEFTIETKDPAFSGIGVTMTIMDMTGRKIADQLIQFSGSKSLQNLNLKPGVYFVNLVSGGVNSTFRLNIEH